MIPSLDHEPSPTGQLTLPPMGAEHRLGPPARRGLHWFFAIVGWGLVLGVTLLLYLRWRALDRSLLIGLVGLTPLLVVPQSLAVLSAWASRSASLRVAAGVTTAALLFTTSPVDAVVGCGAASSPDEITIYTANVLAGGGRPGDTAASIVANDPDIVVMQEVRWEFISVLREDARLAAYPYRTDDVDGAPQGTVVWSRWPIRDVTSDRVGSTQFVVHATVDSPHGSFAVSGVHTTAPAVDRNVATWHQQFDVLAAIDPERMPRIMAGDFNATADHQPFRRLLDRGWTDVHERKGCGFDATWPVDHGLPFPLLRLDHVLVSDHYEVLRVGFADPAGSDHRPVVAAVRLTPS